MIILSPTLTQLILHPNENKGEKMYLLVCVIFKIINLDFWSQYRYIEIEVWPI